jgi:translation elongation factor EF-Ts
MCRPTLFILEKQPLKGAFLKTCQELSLLDCSYINEDQNSIQIYFNRVLKETPISRTISKVIEYKLGSVRKRKQRNCVQAISNIYISQ